MVSGSQRRYLITRWGTIVFATETGELKHGDCRTVPDNVYLTEDDRLHIDGRSSQQVEMVSAGRGVLHGVSHGGQFLCAHEEGGLMVSRPAMADWEHFLVITGARRQEILSILQNDWTLMDGRIVRASEIVLERDFTLNFAGKNLNLGDHSDVLTVETSGAYVSAIRFVADGWMICTARRFLPLIYFAVFGPDHIFEMLRICLESIVAFGNYTGTYFILSDRNAEDLAQFVPASVWENVVTRTHPATDLISMMMERYDISGLPIDEFQPVLCIDADMVCNAPLLPMLAACNAADRFFGSSEFNGQTFDRIDSEMAQWFGSFLFTAAGLEISDFCCLNGGAISFANKHFADPVLKMTKTSFKNYRLNFPDHVAKGEQPVLNYVLQSQGLIDARKLNEYIGFRNQHSDSPAPKSCLLHFNSGLSRNKAADMSAYFETLRAERELQFSNKDIPLKINRSIPGQMTDKELARLAFLASQVPPGGIIVEVGCLYGLSSWHISQHCQPGVTLFCIDPWERVSWIIGQVEGPMNAPKFGREAFETFTADCNNIVMVQGFSPDIARGWKLAIDMYVEDAIHTNPELAANITFWADKVRQGGVVCGHDYGNEFPDVASEAEALAARYSSSVEVVDTFWSVIKA